MSDILIRGMDMPEKTNTRCMLIKNIDGSVGLHVCTRSGEVSSDWAVYNLTSLPDHGELIDLDAFLDETCKKLAEENGTEYALAQMGFLRYFFEHIAPPPVVISSTKQACWLPSYYIKE